MNLALISLHIDYVVSKVTSFIRYLNVIFYSQDISLIFHNYCFVHPIFCFWFFVTIGHEVTKIRKYYIIFVYLLQGKMGKKEKNRKENHATKVAKIPKTKRRKCGMNDTLITSAIYMTKIVFERFKLFCKGPKIDCQLERGSKGKI